jgi:hypothetical protein
VAYAIIVRLVLTLIGVNAMLVTFVLCFFVFCFFVIIKSNLKPKKVESNSSSTDESLCAVDPELDALEKSLMRDMADFNKRNYPPKRFTKKGSKHVRKDGGLKK